MGTMFSLCIGSEKIGRKKYQSCPIINRMVENINDSAKNMIYDRSIECRKGDLLILHAENYHRTITFGIHHDLSLNSTLAIESTGLVQNQP
jgi:hypothetical protein